jgi:hypothetical protein
VSVDTRPKLTHFLSKMLVQSRTQNNFWSKPFITISDLLFLEAMAFEKCGIIGTLCQDARIPFFRVLAVPEGREMEGIAATEDMSEDFVMPYIDSPTISELIFQHSRSKTNFDGELGDFLTKHGKDKLPVDKAAVSVSVWASLGGYIGLEYPDTIEDWLHQSYSKLEDLGFTAEQARVIEAEIGSSPYSVEEVEQQAIDMFGEFCKGFYPNEVKEFSFL